MKMENPQMFQILQTTDTICYYGNRALRKDKNLLKLQNSLNVDRAFKILQFVDSGLMSCLFESC